MQTNAMEWLLDIWNDILNDRKKLSVRVVLQPFMAIVNVFPRKRIHLLLV